MPDNSAAYKKAFDPAASVFVSANAGAGKTSLLANRVLSLLLSGVAPGKILCLTFTHAAASEMSTRILKELGGWVMMDKKSLAAALSALLEKPPNETMMSRARGLFALVLEAPEGIRIQTIHGFCQSLLKRFPVEAGISPHFTVMDSRSEQEMLGEARTRLFNHAREEDTALQAAIHALSRLLSETSFNELLADIVTHKRKFIALLMRSHSITHAIDGLWHRAKLPPQLTLEKLTQKHFSYDEKMLAALRGIAEKLLAGSVTDRKRGEGMACWFASGERHRLCFDYTEHFLTQEGKKRAQLFTKQGLTDPLLIEILLAEQDRVLRFYEEALTLETVEQTIHLLHMAHALLVIYDGLKRVAGFMDYDDLILEAGRLLSLKGISPWVLYKLDGGIDHVLVDEAQDTSPEQWAIIDALTQDFFAGASRSEGWRSLFVVGDEKQSIFSFQGADVEALGGMQRYFLKRIEDAAQTAHRIGLTRSFRSVPEVLKAVDAVFARPEARSGLMFGEGELSHIATRLEHPGLVELWPLIRGDENETLSPVTREARRIADTIAGWLKDGVMLEAKGRSIEAGDIMILVRKRHPFVAPLVRALKKRDIPVAGIDRMMLGDNLAVQDLLALGQIVLLPEDDLTLAALLKSPILGVSEEALFDLAWDRAGQSLWERLREAKDDACQKAYALLADLRARADFISPFELYSHLLDTDGARRRITGRMGEEYNDPIDEFLAQALLYERSHAPSLQGFLHWLMHSESEIKRDMEQAGNRVRIMTVYAAKGLQAPIVILPDTAEPPTQSDALLWDDEDGLPRWVRSAKRADALCRNLRERQKQRMLAEYRRLLYVALTRAEDRLYISGATQRSSPSKESWHELVKEGLSPVAAAYAAPLGEGLRIGSPPACHPEELATRDPLKKILRSAQDDKEFGFLHHSLPEEPVPSRPLTPSRLPGAEPAGLSPLVGNDSYQRGLIIHRLLQHLPELSGEERARAAAHLTAGYARTMDAATLKTCVEEALSVIDSPDFARFFSASSLAEVPVTGTVTLGDKKVTVSGQIDRLYVGEDEVWIVDFKTNRLPPEWLSDIPLAYKRQLLLYKILLTEIYPDKTVRCALLWSAVPRIDVLDDALLDETAVSSYI